MENRIDILNEANAIVRHATALSTMSELSYNLRPSDVESRCDAIVQYVEEIRRKLDGTATPYYAKERDLDI